MKKINEDLEIVGIDISDYRTRDGLLTGAELTFKFLNQFFANALYFENSTGYSWFETNEKSAKIHESFDEAVEDNEDEIIDYINEQIKAYKEKNH